MLSIVDLAKIKSKIFAKIAAEIEIANREDLIDDLLNKYGIVIEYEQPYVDTRRAKILVLGSLAGNIDDYKVQLSKLGLNKNNVEFISDYNELKRFDAQRLEYSTEYSDIIYGPNPHKQINIGDNASLLTMLQRNPEKYPRVIEAVANNKLKISINSFREAVLKTRLFESIYS